jgi:urea carboxylase
MEGPGGYQFVGRTVQMWNRYRQTAEFRDGKQWLLRFFDQIRFYPVSGDELMKMRAGFPYGRHPLRIEESRLDLGDYLRFLEEQRESIDAFRTRQRSAFDAERERWRVAGVAETPIAESAINAETPALPDDCVAITSPVSGSVWQIKVAAGQAVAKGETLVIMEAMKMEIAVIADSPGTVVSIHGKPGAGARAGDTLLLLRPELP